MFAELPEQELAQWAAHHLVLLLLLASTHKRIQGQLGSRRAVILLKEMPTLDGAHANISGPQTSGSPSS